LVTASISSPPVTITIGTRAPADAADRAAGGEAVHARHLDVHQDQVGRMLAASSDGLRAVRGLDAVQADLLQHLEHQEAHHRIVVGDQHDAALCWRCSWHVRFPSLGWR
jgi:hypothetical protein